MLSAVILLLTNSLMFTLRLNGSTGSFPKPLSAAEEKQIGRASCRERV